MEIDKLIFQTYKMHPGFWNPKEISKAIPLIKACTQIEMITTLFYVLDRGLWFSVFTS